MRAAGRRGRRAPAAVDIAVDKRRVRVSRSVTSRRRRARSGWVAEETGRLGQLKRGGIRRGAPGAGRSGFTGFPRHRGRIHAGQQCAAAVVVGAVTAAWTVSSDGDGLGREAGGGVRASGRTEPLAHGGALWRSRPGANIKARQNMLRTRVCGAGRSTADGHLYGSDVEAVGAAINALLTRASWSKRGHGEHGESYSVPNT